MANNPNEPAANTNRFMNGGSQGSSDPLMPVKRDQMSAHRATHPQQRPSNANAGQNASSKQAPVNLGATERMNVPAGARVRQPLPDYVPANPNLGTIDADAEPYDFNQQPDIESEQPRNHRGLKIGLAVAGGIIVAAYVGGIVAFSNLNYPGTVIAGQDVSLTTASAAAEKIESSVGAYSLAIDGLGFEWTYEPAEGTYSIDASAETQAVIAANEALIWPVRLIMGLTGNESEAAKNAESQVVVNYDEATFEQELGAAIDAFNANRTGTFDAAGAFDTETGQFTVAKARSNQKLSRDAVIAAGKEAVSRADTTLTLDDSMYEPLAGGADDAQLQAACDAANELIGASINLKLGETDIATLDGQTMMQWVTFDQNLNPTLNQEQLAAWVRELAVSKLDTSGTQRTYTRPDGKQVTVSGGSYGWISDEAALVQQIQDAVANKQTGDIEIPMKQTADKYAGMGGREWGAYIDVDLSEQHVRFYDENDSLIWEAPCISGNPTTDHATPTGVYKVNSNDGGATLVGRDENGDGEPDYRTPVQYWMPFVGGSIGFHDADWQANSSFSDPTAYRRVGSHGCINLQPSKAAELHELLYVGLCVIVHD